ncbi:unnamed protein product (macronuclear) [Paramecium tetraurelia]|uniref:Uncharacterized protein n=1 Tax=Paramecium tetraurelia TaxID=5888 RepID=A0BFF1_PARTE|nr:uncharacterized protein GSPATT00028303001 [Paramecium tetraurelia]CAK57268.1 unnamed protein product [Paramecium tetraurelia]|eukprot:XP_001424666.1 hypothetical protein (macronuclear) [Paramecium tetraurelia strain d4-2]
MQLLKLGQINWETRCFSKAFLRGQRMVEDSLDGLTDLIMMETCQLSSLMAMESIIGQTAKYKMVNGLKEIQMKGYYCITKIEENIKECNNKFDRQFHQRQKNGEVEITCPSAVDIYHNIVLIDTDERKHKVSGQGQTQ